MAIDLSVHTIVIRCRLSKGEALQICQLYKKNLAKNIEISCDEIRCAGINKIVMNGYYKQADEKYPNGLYQYETYITMNVGRLIKKTDNRMLIMDKVNSRAVCDKIEDYFRNKLLLRDKHCFVDNWHLSRLDCGIDIEISTDDKQTLGGFIKALHDSFDITNSRDIGYEQWKGWDAPDVQYQSIRLCSAKNSTPPYIYNIYYKLQQLLNEAKKSGKSLSQKEIDEVKNVIRIEKQIFSVSKLLGTSKLSVLLDEDVKEKTMDKIIKEIRMLFGVGNYLPDDIAIARIDASTRSAEDKHLMKAMYTFIKKSSYSSLIASVVDEAQKRGLDVKNQTEGIKLIRKKLEDLGVSVACSTTGTEIKGISSMLDKVLLDRKKPRKKGVFSNFTQDPQTGRLCINPTIFKIDDPKYRIRMRQKVDESREAFEVSVFEKIRAILNQNYRSAKNKDTAIAVCEHGYKDFSGYATVVESQIVKEKIENILMKIEQRQEKLRDEI